MKVLAVILLFMICSSCADTDTKINELNQRITRLEQRMDSLTNTKKEDAIGYINQGASSANDHCRGITKKGIPCKRKAKTNGYCWQHGG
jgi:outer membrane murein-binding lipoprotein Lpp